MYVCMYIHLYIAGGSAPHAPRIDYMYIGLHHSIIFYICISVFIFVVAPPMKMLIMLCAFEIMYI